MGEDQERTEAKRARVRRLLIEPLTADGMRFKKGTPEEKVKARLDRIADDFAYMSDQALETLRRTLSTMGEGSARCFWPAYITIRGLAQVLEPAPFEEDAKILGWFKSRAGPDALAAGRHVAEYQFWRAKWRPPINDREREAIIDRAARDAHRAELAQDRLDRGRDPGPGEAEWLQGYRQMDHYVRGLIASKQASEFKSARGAA